MARVITETDADAIRGKTGFRGNTVVVLGDSIALNGAGTLINTNIQYLYNLGWFHWMNEILGQRFNQIYNAGISGQTTTQILARVGSDVISKRPEYCIVIAGINDVQSSVTLPVIQANLREIYGKLTNAGIKVIALTTLSSGNGAGQLDNASKKQVLFNLQRWIPQYARDTPGVMCIEWHKILMDSTTGLSLTGYTLDGTHPNTLGGCRLGMYLASQLSNVVAPAEMLPASNADTDNKAVNPMMLGTTGTTSSETNTGNIATGVTFESDGSAATSTSSKVARTDQIGGEWQQVSVASGGDFKARIVDSLIATLSLSVGDTVELTCEYQTDAAGFTGYPEIGLYLQALNGFTAITGVVSIARSMWHTGLTTGETYVRQDYGVLKTVPLTLPATTTRLMGWFLFRCGTGRAGTFRIGRNGMYKVIPA